MRKTRRFIRNIAKKLTIFAVVFVALINACFYCPMQVQAAESMGEYFANCCEIYNYTSLLYNPSGKSSFSSDYYSTTAFVAWRPSSTTSVQDSVSTRSFTLPLLLFFSTRLLGGSDLTINGRVRLAFNVNWSDIVDDDGTYEQNIALNSVFLGNNENVTCSFYYSRLINHSYSIGCLAYVDINFDNFYVPRSGYGLQLYLDFTSFYHSDLYGTRFFDSFTISPVHSSGYIAFDSTSAFSGYVADSETEEIINGYDDSSGNQVSSDFESSVGSYNEAEDSIFTSSESALDGFSFFDWSGYTGIATGVSFVSSLMVSIYNNFGGMSGIGIVLSVLFSVMFLAIVIGLYRYFK